MSHDLASIGIDVGSRAIKFVGLDARAGEPRVSGTVPRLVPGGPIDGAEVERIAAVLRRRGVWSGSLVLAAPPAVSSTAMLELPPRSSGAPVDRLAQIEMARIMRREPDSIETVAWDVPFGGKAAQHASVMAVACPSESVRAFSEQFEDQGFSVEAIEPPCIALARSVRAWSKAGSFVTVDLGAASGRICVITAGTVTLERELGELGMVERIGCAAAPLGLTGDSLWRLLQAGQPEERPTTRTAEELASTFRERLAEDVQRAIAESIGYVRSRGGAVKAELVALAGWGSQTLGLVEAIAAEGQLPCTAVGQGQIDGVRGLAAGLALRRFEEEYA